MNNQPKGLRLGGRKKGVPNRRTSTIRERLRLLKCDYIAYLAQTVNNEVICGTCRGKGKTEFQPNHGEKPGIRTCQSCWGSGLERLAPKERAWAAGELMQYCEAKLKQVDHTSSDGSNRPVWVVNVAPVVQQPQVTESKQHPRVLDVPKGEDVQ